MGSAPAALQAILGRLVRALDYAARGGFARLETLKGLEGFVRATAAQAAEAGAERAWVERLVAAARGFDSLSLEGRKSAVSRLAGLLASQVALPPSLAASAASEKPAPAIPPAASVQAAPKPVAPAAPKPPAADARRPPAAAAARPVAGAAVPAAAKASAKKARPARKRAARAAEEPAEEEAGLQAVPLLSPTSGPLALPINLVMPLRGKLGATLKRRGMSKVGEVLFYFPRSYEDRREIVPIPRLRPGVRALCAGKVMRIEESRPGGRRLLRVILSDGRGSIAATWYKYWPAMRERYEVGQRWLFSGEARVFGGRWEIVHPEMEPDDPQGRAAAGLGEIVPIYPGLERGEQRGFRALARAVVERYVGAIEDPLPPEVLERIGLAPLGEAVRQAHFPGPEALESGPSARAAGLRRLAFDELFFIELGMALRHASAGKLPGISFTAGQAELEKAIGRLPFQPTGAQRRVLGEIASDMGRPVPMSRLLQGDVGSGKTAVAAVAAVLAADSGYQAALLAPTELLAQQHRSTLERWLAPAGYRTALLTAGVPRREKEAIKRDLASGAIQIAVGTHALLQEDVELARLGLVIVDEQHRFGVLQRAALARKGLHPDVLVMTATPIPRTLAMALYGDLDVSVIDELPPGRTPTTTKVFGQLQRDEAYRIAAAQLAAGRQAFVVYPLVEESEKSDLASATEGAQELAERFPEWRVGLLHGRMKSEEKEAVMAAFRSGEIQALVSTTVIEVGVDVPNATVMVIESAERFGLSQLHQLRGRVGRGGGQGFCLLVAGSQGEAAMSRLGVMERTSDGFVIAEEDLRLRGPGELLGTRQSGLPPLLVADLGRDADLLALARREAFGLVEADPRLSEPRHSRLAKALEERWSERLGLAGVG